MQIAEATALIRGGVPSQDGVWADLGAGTGLFTRVLARLLGPTALIYAVDRDPSALRELARWAEAQAASPGGGTATVVPVLADFRELRSIPALSRSPLDGILVANALHFVAEPVGLLAEAARIIRPGGRLVVVEYDHRPASRWVPYPVSLARLQRILSAVAFTDPEVVGTRPSRYGGELYAAVAVRGEHAPG